MTRSADRSTSGDGVGDDSPLAGVDRKKPVLGGWACVPPEVNAPLARSSAASSANTALDAEEVPLNGENP